MNRINVNDIPKRWSLWQFVYDKSDPSFLNIRIQMTGPVPPFSIYRSISVYIHVLYICLSGIYLYLRMYVCLSIYLSVSLFVCLSVFLGLSLSFSRSYTHTHTHTHTQTHTLLLLMVAFETCCECSPLRLHIL